MGRQRSLVTKRLYRSGKIVEPGTWIWLGGSTAAALSKNGTVITVDDLAELDYQSAGKLGDALFASGTLQEARLKGIPRAEAMGLVTANAEEFCERRGGILSLVESITISDLVGWYACSN